MKKSISNLDKVFLDTSNTSKVITKSRKYKVISLFSGGGGKDKGLLGDFKIYDRYYAPNPYEIAFANDIMKEAQETYNANFSHKLVLRDIREVKNSELPKADVVIGGFPCQDFSTAGNRLGFDSERGLLYLQMKRVIEHIKPLAFVAENVQGLTNLNGTNTIDKIVSDLAKVGYKVSYNLLNAADFLVPQSRKRVFIIGIRDDLLINNLGIPFPKELVDFFNPVYFTSKDAIDDLWFSLDKGLIQNHSKQDYSKAKFYPGKKMQGNLKIDPYKPSPTIRAEHHGNIEGHYRTTDGTNSDDVTTWRRLSVRECARLQSFPDNFIFPTSSSSAYRVIGNAVPPILAWHIFRALSIYLNNLKFLKNKKSIN
jgi:DNA (cytosine-5)-methyltransferase 1